MNVDSPPPNNKQIFQTLCAATSAEVRDGKVTLHDGVDWLYAKSCSLKLDVDEGQAIMAKAFAWRLQR